MIIENSQDIITFELPKEYTNIGIKLSGGADSAILYYAICNYYKDLDDYLDSFNSYINNIKK